MRYVKKWELNAEYNMTQEDKDLLIKDLCARLPYGVKVQIKNEIVVLDSICDDDGYHFNFIGDDKEGVNIEQIKPHLFPLSSMTEEQKYDFYCRFIVNDCDFDDFKEFYLDNGMWHKLLTSLDDIEAIIDWFYKNHFDNRGLIPKGLAIDATGKNIY